MYGLSPAVGAGGAAKANPAAAGAKRPFIAVVVYADDDVPVLHGPLARIAR